MASVVTRRKNPVNGVAKLTAPQLEAARLMVEARSTDSEIARKIGVNRDTIHDWRYWPPFQAHIVEIGNKRDNAAALAAAKALYQIQERRYERIREIVDSLRDAGIEFIRKRDDCATDDPDIGLEICFAKGEYYPGAETGLLTREEKMIGGGESARTVIQWNWQVGLLRELRGLEKDILDEEERMGRLVDDAKKRIAELKILDITAKLKAAELEAQKKAAEGSGPLVAWTAFRRVTPERTDEDKAALAEVLEEIDREDVGKPVT